VLRSPGDSINALLESEMRDRVRAAVETLSADMRMAVGAALTPRGCLYDEDTPRPLGCSGGYCGVAGSTARTKPWNGSLTHVWIGWFCNSSHSHGSGVKAPDDL
jgi:hypothetical protein